jgi:hypothetical protein
MKHFPGKLAQLASLILLVTLLSPFARAATSKTYNGQYSDARWDSNNNPIAPATVNFSGTLYWGTTKIPFDSGPGRIQTNCQWIVRRSSDGYTFNLGDVLYYPDQGRWDEFTGTISLRYTHQVNQGFGGVEVYVYSVAIADGAAVGVFEGINAVNIGDRTALRMRSLNQARLAGLSPASATGASSSITTPAWPLPKAITPRWATAGTTTSRPK